MAAAQITRDHINCNKNNKQFIGKNKFLLLAYISTLTLNIITIINRSHVIHLKCTNIHKRHLLYIKKCLINFPLVCRATVSTHEA